MRKSSLHHIRGVGWMGQQQTKVEWESAWTLEDYLFELFEMKKTDTEEFKVLVRLFSREKIKAYYLKYQEKKLEFVK